MTGAWRKLGACRRSCTAAGPVWALRRVPRARVLARAVLEVSAQPSHYLLPPGTFTYRSAAPGMNDRCMKSSIEHKVARVFDTEDEVMQDSFGPGGGSHSGALLRQNRLR
jgi:hypothetical protein